MASQIVSREFRVKGISCVGCISELLSILSESGIKDFEFDHETLKLVISCDEKTLESLRANLKKKGFELLGFNQEFQIKELLITFPFVLVLQFSHFFGLHIDYWLQFLLSVPVLILLGPGTFLTAIKKPQISLEFFVSISVIAGFLLSFYSVLTNQAQFFFAETYTTILFIISLGSFIEKRAFSKLTSIFPQKSRLFASSYKNILPGVSKVNIVEIPPQNISVGAIIIFGPGERIPVDVRILRGFCWVSEEVLTGQPIPVLKRTNDQVLAGSLVLEGQIEAVAESDFFSSSLRNFLDTFKERGLLVSKSNPLNHLLNYFVPIVIGIALGVFIYQVFLGNFSQGFIRSLAVLVVACPCAIGIAVPLVLSLAGLRALKLNCLVKSGDVFLLISKAKTFFLDKTGTLTSGTYKLESFQFIDDETKDRLISAESSSSHPFAKAILEKLSQPKNFYLVTDVKFLEDGVKFTFSDNRELFLERVSRLGFNVYLDGIKKGEFVLKESKKEGLGQALNFLKRRFKNIAILTGDILDQDFKQICEDLNITIRSNLKPDDKLKYVKSATRPVVFVGDGLNDSSAISAADIGISFSASVNVVQDKSDVVFLTPQLENLINLTKLSDYSVKLIHQNLFWAFFYNIIMIPLAAFGVINPALGALGMVVSDLVVVLNSFRIYKKRF